MSESKQVVFTSPGHVEIQKCQIPQIGAGDLLMRVRRVGVCATDLHLLDGHIGDPFPLVPGHEFVGEVAAIGPSAATVRGLVVGDHLTVEMLIPCGACEWCHRGEYNLCAEDDVAHRAQGREYGVNLNQCHSPGFWGGYAEYLYVPPGAITHRIRPEVPWNIAALVEPLAVACRTVKRGKVSIGDDVVIVGPGPVGLLAAAAARSAGARRVVLIGTREKRLNLALKFGVSATVNSRTSTSLVEAVSHELGGRLADVVIETAGVSEAQTDAIRLARRGGRVVLAGALGSDVPVTFLQDEDVLLQELEIVASFLSAGGYRPAIDMLEKGEYPFADLISHEFSIDDIEHALAVVRNKSDNAFKVLIDPTR